MVSKDSDTPLGAIFAKVFSILLSPGLLYGVGLFLIVLIIAAHIIWLLERRHNPQFSRGYLHGIWQSIWWAVVTVTTVGYGDKTPKGRMGRLFALIWILAGYFVFAYFTASVTTTVTVQELQGSITGPQDLFGKKVATVERSTAADYLTAQGLSTVKLADIEKAYDLLEAGEVDAVVFDAPVLAALCPKKRQRKGEGCGSCLSGAELRYSASGRQSAEGRDQHCPIKTRGERDLQRDTR